MRDHRPVEHAKPSWPKFDDTVETRSRIGEKPVDVYAEGRGEEGLEQAKGVRQQVDCAFVVAAKDVVEAGGDLDDALIEVGERALFALLPTSRQTSSSVSWQS
jgi:hypothetical protein